MKYRYNVFLYTASKILFFNVPVSYDENSPQKIVLYIFIVSSNVDSSVRHLVCLHIALPFTWPASEVHVMKCAELP